MPGARWIPAAAAALLAWPAAGAAGLEGRLQWAGRVELDRFRGLAAVGGFSYADVLDSAKGWAGVIRFHGGIRGQFEAFVEREDTFTLGVCNGCQLFALLGLVPWRGLPDTRQPRFVHNASGRFESRFATVRIASRRPDGV